MLDDDHESVSSRASTSFLSILCQSKKLACCTCLSCVIVTILIAVIVSVIVVPWFYFQCDFDVQSAADTYTHWVPERIAFGSCNNPSYGTGLLGVVADHVPDMFLWLGDNIYADTHWPQMMRWKYNYLSCDPNFQYLAKRVSLQLATWDDHDYGVNDGDMRYDMKRESREIFLDFWRVPKESVRRTHEPIYNVHRFRNATYSLNVVLLDLRWDRTPEQPCQTSYGGLVVCVNTCIINLAGDTYCPDPEGKIMSDEQWGWLEAVLTENVDLTIIASSSQMLRSFNTFEGWSLYPQELSRFLNMTREIADTRKILVVSGDVHFGEISRKNGIYDVTSSGLTHFQTEDENMNRVGPALPGLNFGEIHLSSRTVFLFDGGGLPFVNVTF